MQLLKDKSRRLVDGDTASSNANVGLLIQEPPNLKELAYALAPILNLKQGPLFLAFLKTLDQFVYLNLDENYNAQTPELVPIGRPQNNPSTSGDYASARLERAQDTGFVIPERLLAVN